MRKVFYYLSCLTLLAGFTSCKEEEPLIWDYAPITYEIYVHNSEGRNLLDPSTEGNILDKDIFINYNGETLHASYGWPENPFSLTHTRALPAFWYGIFIAPAFTQYGPDLGNHICIGEFDGASDDEFELVICGNSYDFKFVSEIGKDGSLTRTHYMNGYEDHLGRHYLRFDENLKDINYGPKK